MTPDELELWKKAGKITAEAREYGRALVVEGASIKGVCDKIDAKIRELGAEPAWPTQASMNDVAAHYTPDPDDAAVFGKDIVCLDMGASIDGFIGDTACTVDLTGKHAALVRATEDALQKAIAVVRSGVALSEIGRAIQEAITAVGFQPIRNLSGHGINRYEIHASPSIPNHDTGDQTVLEEGMIVAIEPFATTGVGKVEERDAGNIFSQINTKPVRSPHARDVLRAIESRQGLPFTTRWLATSMPLMKAKLGIRELLMNGNIIAHPPLVEAGNGMVAVTEHTLLVTKDGCEVLTE